MARMVLDRRAELRCWVGVAVLMRATLVARLSAAVAGLSAVVESAAPPG